MTGAPAREHEKNILRFNGTLKKWHADRGLGFVVADEGGDELFVHVSAFPRDVMGEQREQALGRLSTSSSLLLPRSYFL